MSDRKIAKANDIHPYQRINAGHFAVHYFDPSDAHNVRQVQIHKIDIGLPETIRRVYRHLRKDVREIKC